MLLSFGTDFLKWGVIQGDVEEIEQEFFKHKVVYKDISGNDFFSVYKVLN